MRWRRQACALHAWPWGGAGPVRPLAGHVGERGFGATGRSARRLRHEQTNKDHLVAFPANPLSPIFPFLRSRYLLVRLHFSPSPRALPAAHHRWIYLRGIFHLCPFPLWSRGFHSNPLRFLVIRTESSPIFADYRRNTLIEKRGTDQSVLLRKHISWWLSCAFVQSVIFYVYGQILLQHDQVMIYNIWWLHHKLCLTFTAMITGDLSFLCFSFSRIHRIFCEFRS